MSKKVTNLPDESHVMRYVPWTKLRRDENDNVIGFLPQAFQLRLDEEGLSVNWVEFFNVPSTQKRDCIWALRESRKAGRKSAFGIGNVGKIKNICLSRDIRVRVLHEPKEDEPAHASIRRLPQNDLALLEALADDVFNEIITNGDVPYKPTGE